MPRWRMRWDMARGADRGSGADFQTAAQRVIIFTAASRRANCGPSVNSLATIIMGQRTRHHKDNLGKAAACISRYRQGRCPRRRGRGVRVCMPWCVFHISDSGPNKVAHGQRQCHRRIRRDGPIQTTSAPATAHGLIWLRRLSDLAPRVTTRVPAVATVRVMFRQVRIPSGMRLTYCAI